MHEIGALHQLVQQAEAVAKANGLKKIQVVNIELGELSGMLPEFFRSYYDIVIENRPLFFDSKLEIKIIKGQGLCNDCQALYNVASHEGRCPICGSRNKKILGGTDLILKNIVGEKETANSLENTTKNIKEAQ